MRGVVCGITIVAGMPRHRAASATPCAWLPAEAQITPRRAMVSDRCAILLYAPRTLNENTGCRSSRLNSTALPRRRLSRGASSSGDSIATSYTRALRTVSYTHLRAHETPEHLVCRLLLE